MHRLENIEEQEEKESGSVEIMLNGQLVTEFPLKRVKEIMLALSRSLCDCANKFKDWHADTIQMNRR